MINVYIEIVNSVTLVCTMYMPAMQETWVQEDLEKGMATHSCLENPTDRGAYWATVHGVSESRIQLSNSRSTSYTIIYHVYSSADTSAAIMSVCHTH